ncbi:unnamed protein product [Calypogeia fissa]
MTGLLKLRDEVFSMAARQESVTLDGQTLLNAGQVTSFKPVPGADLSMERKESFVDKMFKRGRRKVNAIKKKTDVVTAPEVVAAPFVRVVTVKKSDQQILDKAALKCIDLNEDPDWHYTAAMGRYKKPTKVVSSQKTTLASGVNEGNPNEDHALALENSGKKVVAKKTCARAQPKEPNLSTTAKSTKWAGRKSKAGEQPKEPKDITAKSTRKAGLKSKAIGNSTHQENRTATTTMGPNSKAGGNNPDQSIEIANFGAKLLEQFKLSLRS